MVHLGLRQSKELEVAIGRKSCIHLFGLSRATVKQVAACRKQNLGALDRTSGQKPHVRSRQSPGRVSIQLINRIEDCNILYHPHLQTGRQLEMFATKSSQQLHFGKTFANPQ